MNMIVLAGVLAFSIFSSTSGNAVEKEARDHDINVELDLSSAMNAFGWDLYQELRDTSKNFVFSPLSVDFGAFLLWGKAQRVAKKQLRDALHLSDKYDDDTWMYGYDDLLNDLEKERRDSTWGLVYQVLDAILAETNGFVANGTNNRIKNFIESFKLFDSKITLNAAHFDGYWRSPFDPSKTHSAPFKSSTGNNVTVQMVQQTGNFPYYDAVVAQALKLNYKDGFSMIIVLPEESLELNILEDMFTSEDWELIYKALEENPTDVAVTLPKFSFESKFELSGPLQQLGVRNIFIKGEDPNVYIRSFLHQTVVNVTETGTGAAAASGHIKPFYFPTSRSGDSVSFTANRPFFFVIRDDKFKTNLLFGRFEEP